MAISDKLTQIQTEIKAPKNLYNSFGKYKYRNAEGICEAVKPYLAAGKCSLTLADTIEAIGGRVYVKATATLVDNESGESVTVSAYAREAEEKKGMDDAQVTGATSSYARKYALNGLFLLDDTKDPDTDEYRNEKEEKQKAEQDKKKTEAVGKQKINKTKVDALHKLFLDRKVDEAKVLVLYKVDRLENITEAQHSNILANIEKIAGCCGL